MNGAGIVRASGLDYAWAGVVFAGCITVPNLSEAQLAH
jgi:hypothetical protein